MRVIQVVGEFSPERCGVAHYTSRLAGELSRLGVSVAIAGCRSSSESPVDVLPLRAPRWSVGALIELLAIARRWRADWLHLQYAPGSYQHSRAVGLLPLLARGWPGGPRIATTIHEYGGWSLRPPDPLARIADATFSLTEKLGWLDRESLALIGLSHLAAVTNPSHLQVVADGSERLAARLELLPIGPNVGPEAAPEPTREAARARLGTEADRFVAVFFGFVHPVKGIATLLEAMRIVKDRRPDARLWLVGGVESLALRGSDAVGYAEWIHRSIVDLGLTSVASATGYLPDPEAARLLRAADLAVLPLNHGVTMKSGSLITCLSFGLPVLATGTGDVSELRHGENVWLVPPRDPDALALAMLDLAADPGRRDRIASAGRALAERFAWPDIARRHVDLYASPNSSRGRLSPGTATAPSPRSKERS